MLLVVSSPLFGSVVVGVRFGALKQLLCVGDHVLGANYAGRYLVAGRPPRRLNVARRRLGVPRRVAQEGLPAVGIVNLPADSCEIPRELCRGRYVVLVGSGCVPSKTLIAEEEKCLPGMFARDGSGPPKVAPN